MLKPFRYAAWSTDWPWIMVSRSRAHSNGWSLGKRSTTLCSMSTRACDVEHGEVRGQHGAVARLALAALAALAERAAEACLLSTLLRDRVLAPRHHAVKGTTTQCVQSGFANTATCTI